LVGPEAVAAPADPTVAKRRVIEVARSDPHPVRWRLRSAAAQAHPEKTPLRSQGPPPLDVILIITSSQGISAERCTLKARSPS
jgi:hypothetical protein